MITSSMKGFKELDYAMQTIAVGLEVVGVAVIVLGALLTASRYPSSPLCVTACL